MTAAPAASLAFDGVDRGREAGRSRLPGRRQLSPLGHSGADGLDVGIDDSIGYEAKLQRAIRESLRDGGLAPDPYISILFAAFIS
ncbi:MAG: hypothetical protein J2P54_08170 [Bradyrhizobiaceae bacterium]|nr:hypothetical protein [Bradyrhizobiaceae bacterium]